jgi:putative transposase
MATVIKTFKYRLQPTKKQIRTMNHWLDECRWLYNHFLEERIKTYEDLGVSISFNGQAIALPDLKKERHSLTDIYSQVLTDVAKRVDRSFRNFFRRVKEAKEKPGYPRFRGKGRYNSFTFIQYGFKLINNKKLSLSKIGDIKIVLHMPIEGNIKTCTIKRSTTDKWYVSFVCECESTSLPVNNNAVGVDVGLNSFVTISTGDYVDNPRFFRQDEKALAKAQRKLSKANKGTPERAKRRKVVARIHERIRFRRQNFCHQVSRNLIDDFDTIVIEDLNVKKMIQNLHIAKSIQDAAWSELFRQLTYKAEWAGRKLVIVNPAYTSQTCSKCGYRQEMPLNKRIYCCSNCGQQIDRDHNAAINILTLGLHSHIHSDYHFQDAVAS